MTEDNRIVPTDATHSGGTTLPEGASESTPRNINPVPAVHTKGGNEGIKLPESKDDIIADSGAPRFIKTGNAPKVTTHGDTESATDVDKFTDRLSVRPQQRMHTGYTGKIRTYADVHAAPADRMKRMILSEESEFSEIVNADNTRKMEQSDGFLFKAEDMEIVEQAEPIENGASVKTDSDDTATAATNGTASDEENGSTVKSADDTAGTISETNATEKTAETPTAGNHDPNSGRTKKIAPNGELLREIAGTATDDVPQDPDQMMMNGYSEADADGEREEALRKTRAKKISSYHFWNKAHTQETGAKTDEKFTNEGSRELPEFLQRMADRFAGLDSSFTPIDGNEYNDIADRKTIFKKLMKTRSFCLMRAAGIALLGIILFIIDFAVSINASNNGGLFTILGGNSLVYNIINSVFLVIAALVMFPDLKSGVCSLLKVQPKTDTALLITFIFALIQNAALYSSAIKAEYDLHLLAPAAVLSAVPYLTAKLFFYDSTRQCFKAVSAKSDKSYLRKVSDVNLVKEILRDSDADESINVVYAGKTKFISSFLHHSADSANAAMPDSRLVAITTCASILLGLLAAILSKSFSAGITASSLTLLISFPVGSLLALGKLLASENNKLSIKSSFVQSYTDAHDFSCVDDIVIDDTDVIKAEVTKCISAKNVKENQAKFVAGALTNASGGLLKKTFASGIVGFEERMPPVDGLVYEDKLGVSAWVSGCKILLGSHALLVNHNVGVPDESIVDTLIEEGCKSVYLAIEGRFAALFSVKYTPLNGVADNLKILADNGANVLISTIDANISDSYAEQLLCLPEDSVRTLPKRITDKLSSSRTTVTDSEEAGVVFGDSVDSLCRCAAASIRLDSAKRISNLICTSSSVFGMAITALLILTGAYTKISSIVPIMLQTIWTAFCFVSPGIFAGAAKPRKRKALKRDISESRDKPNGITDKKESAANEDKMQSNATQSTSENTAENAPENEKSDAANTSTAEEIITSAEKTDESDDPISAETYSALDAFAEDQEKAEGKKPRGKRASNASAADGGTADNGGEYSDDAQANSNSGVSGKLKNVFSGIFTRATPENSGELVEEEDIGDNDTTVNDTYDEDFSEDKNRKKRGFKSNKKSNNGPVDDAEAQPEQKKNKGILIPGGSTASHRKNKVTYDTAFEIEAAYKKKKDEDRRVRDIFTAPEIPSGPHYDLNEKPQEEAKFVPPTNTGSINVFDDSIFSPFEDDKIFAGIHDSTSAKFDF